MFTLKIHFLTSTVLVSLYQSISGPLRINIDFKWQLAYTSYKLPNHKIAMKPLHPSTLPGEHLISFLKKGFGNNKSQISNGRTYIFMNYG